MSAIKVNLFNPFALHSFRCCLGLEWPQMRGSCPYLFSQIHLHQLKEFTAVQESFFFFRFSLKNNCFVCKILRNTIAMYF